MTAWRVREGAAAAVFADTARRSRRTHQRQGQRLLNAPVDIDLLRAHGGAVVNDLLHQRAHLKVDGIVVSRSASRFHRRQRSVGRVGPLLCRVGAQSTAYWF